MWDPQWPALIEAVYRLVRCDFRGFGGTPAADRPCNDAEDVMDLLDTEREQALQRHAFGVQLAAEEFEPVTADFDLSAIKAPCLIVSGGHDMADFRQIAARLAGLLTDAQQAELPWAGHLPSMERPSAVTGLLAGFLREKVPAG